MIITYAREDESASSWLIRLARANGNTLNYFLKSINCEDVLKGSIDIDSDWSILKNNFKPDFSFPQQIIDKLIVIEWAKGRSKWLIEPNKRGSAQFNSYTQICPSCLKNKEYFQQKWKITIITGCQDCGLKLVKNCPNCSSPISPILSQRKSLPHEPTNSLFKCYRCEYDLRKAKTENLRQVEYEKLTLIIRSYKETPCNLVYLKHLLDSFP